MSVMFEEQPSATITIEEPPVLTLTSNVTVGSGSGSSDYNDLTNKPQINSVELAGNKSLSDLGIQAELVSGTSIKTVNSQSLLGDGDITITVPTKTSDLTNDSGFITSESVPTKLSDLTNDEGFIDNTVNDLVNYYTEDEIDDLLDDEITVTGVNFNGSTAVVNKTANIVVNPNLQEATTAKLSKLKIGNVNYKLSGGGASIYNNYQSMVTALNAMPSGELEEGYNIYILTMNVPDMWISKNDETISVPYVYTTDTQLLVDMASAGGSLQVGYHRIAQLETEKVNIPVQDVKIDGTTCVTNNTALIPLATTSVNGAMSSTDKVKLDSIEAGAEVNDVTDIQVNGTTIVASGTGIANITDATLAQVKYTSQTLTDNQKAQARTNISAITMEEYNPSATSYEEGVIYYKVEA